MFISKKKLTDIVVKDNTSIFDSLKLIQKSSLQILLVKNNLDQIIGILNDGDIRRGLLSGLNLKTQIKKIIKKDFFYFDRKVTNEKLYNFFIEKGILQIPLLTKDKKIVGLYAWHNSSKRKKINNTMVILAGGKGTRLMPLTKKIPKPMLKIKNKNLIEHIILKAKIFGIKDFIIIVNYLSEKIKNYFQDGRNHGVKISYLEEEKPLGTAGSILKIRKKLPLIVANGDVISNINLIDMVKFHNQNKANITMALHVMETSENYGVVKLDGFKVKKISEKPINRKLINAGIYIINTSIFKNKKINQFLNQRLDMPNLIKISKNEKMNILGFPFFDFWIDIGTKDKLNLLGKSKNFEI